jgi:hypothetical protein
MRSLDEGIKDMGVDIGDTQMSCMLITESAGNEKATLHPMGMIMTDLRITELKGLEVSSLDSIINAYQYNHYRRYRSVSRKAEAKYLSGLTKELLARDGVKAWFAFWRELPVGFAAISSLEWDSDFFGLRMAQLDVIVSAEQLAQVFLVADKLLSTAIEAACYKKIRHLSLRVDFENIELIHALEKHGFRLMDSLVVYAFQKGKNHLPKIRPRYDLRLYRSEDFDAVDDIATTCFKDYPGRFTVDPHISKQRARTFYRQWAKNCCKGTMAEEVLVAERKGHVIGFLAYGCNPVLKRYTGISIIGGKGLGGCYPFRFNAYLELLREATRRSLTVADTIEVETQLFNVATINYYQKLDFSYVGGRHSFHLWLNC